MKTRKKTGRSVGGRKKEPKPPAVIEGDLFDWFETGCEGVIWTVYDDVHRDHAALHMINEGDHLTILTRAGERVWEGTIECDRQTGVEAHPFNPEFKQQLALGQWIHWIQRGFEPDAWAGFFIRPDDIRLRGVLRRKHK